MKATVLYVALNVGNESTNKTFDIDSGELALMIETYRREHAQQAGTLIENTEHRHQ